MTVKLRHTGIWPFNLLNKGGVTASGGNPVIVFDPVAQQFEATPKFTSTGWIGFRFMTEEFLWDVIDGDTFEAEKLIENWTIENRLLIAEHFKQRADNYTAYPEVNRIFAEAILNFRDERYVSVVRTLLPEFERLGRLIALPNGSQPKKSGAALRAMQDYLGEFPVSVMPGLELSTAFHVLSGPLFEKCFTPSDAAAIGPGPNRHAETHGLADYGNLRGATAILACVGLMLTSIEYAHSTSQTST